MCKAIPDAGDRGYRSKIIRTVSCVNTFSQKKKNNTSVSKSKQQICGDTFLCIQRCPSDSNDWARILNNRFCCGRVCCLLPSQSKTIPIYTFGSREESYRKSEIDLYQNGITIDPSPLQFNRIILTIAGPRLMPVV